jgi:Tol biopolymer transport system component
LLVDRPSGFGPLPFDGIGSSEIEPGAASGDGCFVAFTSHSDILSATDENGAQNVFRLDLCSPGFPFQQVNTASDGTPAEAGSDNAHATISDDGRYVAFTSDAANLVPGVTQRSQEILRKDMNTGALELVSRGDGPDGLPAQRARESRISGDGQRVAFIAEGVLDTDNVNGVQGARNAFVRNFQDNTTHMVSLTGDDHQGGGLGDTPPGIDRTGARVAFVTRSRLVAGDTDDDFDAYVRNQIGGAGEATQLVSTGAGADSAGDVALSDSSTKVAWSNGHVWVATCALACGAGSQADDPIPGGSNSGGAERPFFPRSLDNGVPQDPEEVLFTTGAALDPSDTDGAVDLYGRILALAPADGIDIKETSDGEVGGADTFGFLYLFGVQQTTSLPGSDGTTAQVWLVTFGGFVNISQPLGAPPRINEAGFADLSRWHPTSANGRIVAFVSAAPALGSPQRPTGYPLQAVVRDVVSGENTLVSVAPDGVTPGDGDSFDASVDASGRRMVFTSTATNLVPGGVTGSVGHVYLRDLATGVTTLLGRSAAGQPAQADRGRISADGSTVVFESIDKDLPEAPGDGKVHIYRVDLASGRITLVDRSNSGAPGNDLGVDPDVSADGNRVAFVSYATNLGGGPNGNVYVRDVAAGTTTWASVPEDGNPAHSSVFDVAMSADGTRVAFTQVLPEFGYGMIDQDEVFVRDLASGTTVLASTGPAGPAATGASSPSLSGNGTKVTFISDAANLGGPVDRFRTVYVRDLAAGTTSVVAQGRNAEHTAALSPNGACVALASSSDDLTSPSYGPDFTHIMLHALTDDCASAGGGPGGGGADTTAPQISGLRVTHKRFAVGRRSTAGSARAKRGTTFVFRLSEDARTTITISRRLAGRRKGGRCVKPRKGLKRKCTRLVKAARLVRTRTHQGANRIAYTGRIRKRALKRGPYVATVRVVDIAGNRSAPRSVRLRVVRR